MQARGAEFPRPADRTTIRVIDSHTEGEPTRLVVDGFPEVRGETMRARLEDIRAHHDRLRTGMLLEPRGHAALVGAILTPPEHRGSDAGVVFCNDVGYLGMCGHGLIGVVKSLQYLGLAASGTMRIDTPVGTVCARLHAEGDVEFQNVPCRVAATDVSISLPDVGSITGDIAYGGNWFFITSLGGEPALRYANVGKLSALAVRLRDILRERDITGDDGSPIDHIEFVGPPLRADADARNFVLCPGAAFDRSPCGTGTSAKMATLFSRGRLGLGERWRQEGIAGGLFTGSLSMRDRDLIPSIRATAYVTGVSSLVFENADPFVAGIR